MAELFGLVGGVVGPLLVLILLVVPLIVVHELGHLLVARWRGIAVEEFGIGFPPRIAVLHRGARTLLTLNALPFGGFVRMAGATEGSTERDGWERASLLSKTLVMLAGVLVNLLLAFVLMLLLAGPLAERGELTLDAVQPGSPAATAGIVASDKIAALNGVPFDRFETPLANIRALAGEQVSLSIDWANTAPARSMFAKLSLPTPTQHKPSTKQLEPVTTLPLARSAWSKPLQKQVASTRSEPTSNISDMQWFMTRSTVNPIEYF